MRSYQLALQVSHEHSSVKPDAELDASQSKKLAVLAAERAFTECRLERDSDDMTMKHFEIWARRHLYEELHS